MCWSFNRSNVPECFLPFFKNCVGCVCVCACAYVRHTHSQTEATAHTWRSDSLRYRSSSSTLFVPGLWFTASYARLPELLGAPAVLCCGLALSTEWWNNRCRMLHLALLMFWDLNSGPGAYGYLLSLLSHPLASLFIPLFPLLGIRVATLKSDLFAFPFVVCACELNLFLLLISASQICFWREW